jgi:SAM-dependent MidA family methyltransferase
VAHGPVEQGAFLTALGIEARAETLRKANGGTGAQDVDAALRRLIDAEEMGSLFKLLALTGPTPNGALLGFLPGFEG